MGRLIDVDKLEKDIRQYADKKCCHGELELAHGILKSLSIIKEQPTAYDVDKVVEQLKECERYVYDAVSDEDNYVIDAGKVIEIVKGAVKE